MVEKMAHQLNSAKKAAKIEDVYRELRDKGFEIDAESVAYAYQNVPNIMGRKGFSSQADVNRFGGEGIKKALEIANKGDLKKQRLGKYSLNVSVASGLANVFSTLQGRNDVDTSRLKELQDTLKKYAYSLLDKSQFPNVKQSEPFQNILQHYFDVENLAKTNQEAMKGKVKGTLNSMDDIWKAVQGDVEKISKGIKDHAERAQFEQMTQAIKDSSYTIMLTSADADNVIKGVLTQEGYTKEVMKNGQPATVIDWNKALAKRADWRKTFSGALQAAGFSQTQTQRVVDKLESNYEAALSKQAENKLNAIKKQQGDKKPVSRDAVRRLVELRNAGLFADANKHILNEALGVSIPKADSDRIAALLQNYEEDLKNGLDISNVRAEEIKKEISLILSKYADLSKGERFAKGLSDYIAVGASSIISTAFNSIQNITSGINSVVLPSVHALITGNRKMAFHNFSTWWYTYRDVISGGVQPQDSRTINALNALEGHMGVGERFATDNIDGSVWSYLRSALTMLPQLTASGPDAANGAAIYNIEMIKAVRATMKAKGIESPNKKIDDILFGKTKDPITGKELSNYDVAYEGAKRWLAAQDVVVKSDAKARRIADETVWHKLIDDYGFTIEEVKAIQSASLGQKAKDLGHQSDIVFSPSTVIRSIQSYLGNQADERSKKGDRASAVFLRATSSIFNSMNLFMGGKGNWAILQMQNSPIGIGFGVFDMLAKTAISKFNGETPLFAQPLSVQTTQNGVVANQGDAEKLREQLAQRKAIVARFERGILGTLIQTALFTVVTKMASNSGDDDKDRASEIVSLFDRLYDDPNTRRAMDKILPMLAASELAYAYDKKKMQFDRQKLSNSWWIPEYAKSFRGLAQYTKDQVFAKTTIEQLEDRLKWNDKIKDPDEKDESNKEAIMGYVGSLFRMPYMAWWNVERNEMKVISSGITPDPTENARQKAQFKQEIANTDGAMDALLKGVLTAHVVEGMQNRPKAADVVVSDASQFFDQKGVHFSGPQDRDKVHIRANEDHPDGLMTEAEYKQFVDLRQKKAEEIYQKAKEDGANIKSPTEGRSKKQLSELSEGEVKKLSEYISEQANKKAKEEILGKRNAHPQNESVNVQ